MNLMISEAVSRHSCTTAHPGIADDVLSHASGDSALGEVLVARSTRGVCAILFGDGHDKPETELAAHFPRALLVADEAAVHDDLAKVMRFVDNPAAGLRLTLDMRGTPLQRRVWEKLRAIPVGRTMTYLELAHWISPLASSHVLADACAVNPIALAIPCHRVVSTDDDVGNYRWGIARKRDMIRREAMA